MKYVCALCGFIYDEDEGLIDQDIPAGTKFNDLSEDFTCPLCGASKEAFQVQE